MCYSNQKGRQPLAEWEIICDDIMHWAAGYQGKPFAAILCDPPYHLTGGFMGAYWDRDGPDAISFQKETWAALAEHLLPGGFLFVFASSRGWHRLACALEDAGLLIQPSIFNWRTREVVEVPFCHIWLTGQSFPKASRLDKKLDEKAGRLEERKVVGKYKLPNRKEWNLKQSDDSEIEFAPGAFTASGRRTLDIEEPATDLARAWEGHRYGGQILKDAAGPIICAMKPPDTELSPIIVAQKPWEGKRLDCIVETGAGALNIDKARIGIADGDDKAWRTGQYETKNAYFGGDSGTPYRKDKPQGRWPSNFCLVHTKPQPCPVCEGLGYHTWETWYARAKDYGGDREEWDSFSTKTGGKLECGYCDGEGVVGGCERVGVKRVRGSAPASGPTLIGESTSIARGKFSGVPATACHTDPDGMETVDDFLCAENCPARKLGEQSGDRSSARVGNPNNPKRGGDSKPLWGISDGRETNDFRDKGTAARFFYQADWEYECAENCPIAKLDLQAGPRGQPGGPGRKEAYPDDGIVQFGGTKQGPLYFDAGEKGNASRFFLSADWGHEVAERIAGADPVRYCPKAARKERDAGLEEFSIKRSGVGCDRPGGDFNQRLKPPGRNCENPRTARNPHPTVKPISLNKWLATLLLPPEQYAPRRILIPFFGSGSEGIGALLAGWDEIVGIEMDPNYVEIGEARMRFWQAKLQEIGSSDPRAILKTCGKKGTKKQDSSEHSPDENHGQMSLEL